MCVSSATIKVKLGDIRWLHQEAEHLPPFTPPVAPSSVSLRWGVLTPPSQWDQWNVQLSGSHLLWLRLLIGSPLRKCDIIIGGGREGRLFMDLCFFMINKSMCCDSKSANLLFSVFRAF